MTPRDHTCQEKETLTNKKKRMGQRKRKIKITNNYICLLLRIVCG